MHASECVCVCVNGNKEIGNSRLNVPLDCLTVIIRIRFNAAESERDRDMRRCRFKQFTYEWESLKQGRGVGVFRYLIQLPAFKFLVCRQRTEQNGWEFGFADDTRRSIGRC